MFQSRDINVKYTHTREMQKVKGVISEVGVREHMGGEPLRLVKDGLSQPLSRGLNVVRERSSNRGNSMGRNDSDMCSKKRRRRVWLKLGVKRIVRQGAVSGDQSSKAQQERIWILILVHWEAIGRRCSV